MYIEVLRFIRYEIAFSGLNFEPFLLVRLKSVLFRFVSFCCLFVGCRVVEKVFVEKSNETSAIYV